MSYTVVYYSNRARPQIHKAETREEAEELAAQGKEMQYLVDIEDDSVPAPLPEYTD